MSTESLLRVSSIQVEGLFDLYDHQVDLKPDDRVTILHGPNGVGKTMLLRMVNDLLIGRYNLFLQIPFRRFTLIFTDGSEIELTVDPHPSQANSRPFKMLVLSLREDGKQKETLEIPSGEDILSRAEAVAREFPWISRVGENQWFDERGDYLMTSEEVVELYTDGTPPRGSKHLRVRSEPEWLKGLRGSVTAHLIEAQRLLRLSISRSSGYPARPRNVHRVLEYASDLRARINDTMARYGQQSQRLDQSFPKRLLTHKLTTLSADDLKTRMEKLDTKRAELKEIGLLDEPEGHPFDTAALDHLDQVSQKAMGLYVQDTSEKLEVLTDLARRTRLLLDNVNHKFLHKRIRIDREAGLVAERDDGAPLELEALSSGEQHELVLHYDLLFRVRPNTLVLIDEPELSLHLAWQKRFLPDLLEIVDTARFDVLIATHSPYIVGDRSDLMIGLGEDPV
ncbi:AAA family ATPase [Candidatus Thiosymbion oneisti]|uniref:AAA family ATPase n=1 Tax=Candidatus Thiosymbion oneisti TaxID=589554 RepID=UPI000A8E9108|nr:AAA family ATPase [Candidatus Thiosymbion oneisti]